MECNNRYITLKYCSEIAISSVSIAGRELLKKKKKSPKNISKYVYKELFFAYHQDDITSLIGNVQCATSIAWQHAKVKE